MLGTLLLHCHNILLPRHSEDLTDSKAIRWRRSSRKTPDLWNFFEEPRSVLGTLLLYQILLEDIVLETEGWWLIIPKTAQHLRLVLVHPGFSNLEMVPASFIMQVHIRLVSSLMSCSGDPVIFTNT